VLVNALIAAGNGTQNVTADRALQYGKVDSCAGLHRAAS
jgi:hypothetical protein